MTPRKESQKSIAHGPILERVPLSALRPRRRGKHYDLMQRVVKELAELPRESALKVPLGNYSAKDIRSAVSRAAVSESINISTTSDRENLYIWKRA